MESLLLDGRTNFFERPVSDYRQAGFTLRRANGVAETQQDTSSCSLYVPPSYHDDFTLTEKFAATLPQSSDRSDRPTHYDATEAVLVLLLLSALSTQPVVANVPPYYTSYNAIQSESARRVLMSLFSCRRVLMPMVNITDTYQQTQYHDDR